MVPVRNFHMPPNAVSAGHDLDGSKIFVGVSHYNGDEIPCKIVPRRKEAYVSYDGQEIRVHDFKVLTEKKMRWVSASNGQVPSGALPAGKTRSGEILYIGRTTMNGCTVTGKVCGYAYQIFYSIHCCRFILLTDVFMFLSTEKRFHTVAMKYSRINK